MENAHFPECFERFPDETRLFDLNGDRVDRLLRKFPDCQPFFAEHEQRCFLRPRQFEFEDPIRTFSSDKLQGFLYDLRKPALAE